ncbi:MAG: ATP-binding protein [Alphaproteobacteria bacterium]|nr:ATP-binding protein [Rhodospirillales bacterium]MCW9045858.1 ATP-binding protein [Alphaproteobacteria bacterium]
MPKVRNEQWLDEFRLLGAELKNTVISDQTDASIEERLNTALQNLETYQEELRAQNEELVEARERSENLLKKYSALFHNSPVGYFTIDRNSAIIDANLIGAEMLGHSQQHLAGKPLFLYLDLSSRKVIETHFRRVFIGEQSNDEVMFIGPNARPFSALINSSPLLEDNGKIDSCITALFDVTERKHLEEQIRRSQKMEAVGQLTGGIAHDFNNILGIVLGNLELLERMVAGDDRSLERVAKAIKGTKRGADLTKKLLRFSRKEAHEVSLISVSEFVENLEILIAKSLTASINVETRLADDLWQVSVDPGDLEDTLLNLAINARDAMPDGGTLVIETANKTLDESYVKINPNGQTGDFVMITMSDTGEGMSEEVKEKVYDPFFTTKQQGKGTGLGLSMVYGFVHRTGGHISLFSEVDEGTTFKIFIPRAFGEEKKQDTIEVIQDDLPKGTETVLVVDDEEALRDIAVSCLNDLGYETLTAEDGQEALEIIENDKSIDVLFSDIIMPGHIDGYQLAIAAHKSNPDLKILLASGFANKREDYEDGRNPYILRLAKNLLDKPYNQNELAQAIRRAIEE